MTKFYQLSREHQLLVHKAWIETWARMSRPLEPGEGMSLDVVAELFQTAYEMGQKAPRPGDMVVMHHAEQIQIYSEYDKKLQHDIAHLQNEHLPYCKHCKQRHAYSDPCELLQALRQATAYAQEEARRALDTTQPLVIDEPERDDTHEDLGYRGRK